MHRTYSTLFEQKEPNFPAPKPLTKLNGPARMPAIAPTSIASLRTGLLESCSGTGPHGHRLQRNDRPAGGRFQAAVEFFRNHRRSGILKFQETHPKKPSCEGFYRSLCESDESVSTRRFWWPRAPGFDSLRPKTPVFGLSPGSLPRETGHFCPFFQKTL